MHVKTQVEKQAAVWNCCGVVPQMQTGSFFCLAGGMMNRIASPRCKLECLTAKAEDGVGGTKFVVPLVDKRGAK